MAESEILTFYFPHDWTRDQCLDFALKRRCVNMFWPGEHSSEVWRIAPTTAPHIRIERFDDNRWEHVESPLAPYNDPEIAESDCGDE